MDEIVMRHLTFEHRLLNTRLLQELNMLKEKLKPAFSNPIQWYWSGSFFDPLSQLTLTELVPRKGVFRFFVCRRIELVIFTRETLFRSGVLTVLDPRVSQHLEGTAPSALRDCVDGLATRRCVKKLVCVELVR
jgi:hypothetical protein